jgi:hypothetical protein
MHPPLLCSSSYLLVHMYLLYVHILKVIHPNLSQHARSSQFASKIPFREIYILNEIIIDS